MYCSATSCRLGTHSSDVDRLYSLAILEVLEGRSGLWVIKSILRDSVHCQIKMWCRVDKCSSRSYIHNGIIFPLLNHAISDELVGRIAWAVINTSNKVKCLLLWEF